MAFAFIAQGLTNDDAIQEQGKEDQYVRSGLLYSCRKSCVLRTCVAMTCFFPTYGIQ